MKSDFIVALTQLAAERNLPREIVLSAIEAALVSAYRRDSLEAGQDISVKLDPASGDVSVFVVKTVVEEVAEPLLELSLAEAVKIKPDAKIGDVVPTETLPHSAGRIAAQTAKQVVIQRLREAERELVFAEYADREGEVFSVTVQRVEPKQAIVELGRAEALLPVSEQAPYERYRVGQRMKVLLQSIRRSNKGPEMIVSRADNLLLKRLFEMEVPEIYNGSVEIRAIAREPGFRSKVAVWAKQDGVDAVGSCVGLRGIRTQNIVNELHGEKIDVVQWNKDPAAFITSALSPSLVLRVDIDEEAKSAGAIVPERHLSLAIGKEGQNARLAAKLTGWKVDIKSNVEAEAAEKKEGEAVLEVVAVAPTAADQEIEDTAAPSLEVAEAPVEEAVAEEAVATEVEEAAAAVEEKPPAEGVIEEPAAELEAAKEVEVTGEEAEVEAEVPDEVDLLADLDLLEEKPEEEAVPVGEQATSIRDISDEIWSTRTSPTKEPGVIRFAEDIEELGTRGPGRRRRRGGASRDRGRNTRAGGRRR